MTGYATSFFPSNVNYTRDSFEIFVYKITVDNETKRVERTKMMDCEKTINYYKNLGKDVSIEYVGSYLWEE